MCFCFYLMQISNRKIEQAEINRTEFRLQDQAFSRLINTGQHPQKHQNQLKKGFFDCVTFTTMLLEYAKCLPICYPSSHLRLYSVRVTAGGALMTMLSLVNCQLKKMYPKQNILRTHFEIYRKTYLANSSKHSFLSQGNSLMLTTHVVVRIAGGVT